MAAVTGSPLPRVRPPAPGEGAAIATLWHELWDAHEQWGGYRGSRDAAVYAHLARRLDEEAQVRAGRTVLGGHLHLVADLGGAPCGQVEGWLEHRGDGPHASCTCEVRSLIVGHDARRFGVGRALLHTLEKTARSLFRGGSCVLAAEVLEPNPAHAFYARVGFTPVAWSAYLATAEGASIPVGHRTFAVRMAVPDDALAIAHLEEILWQRRLAAGDARFSAPPAIDAMLLGSIAANLADEAASSFGDRTTVVAVDRGGVVRGAATVSIQTLEPPFLPVRRGLVGRFALDPATPAALLAGPLVGLGARLAASRGAAGLELTDLPGPGSELHDALTAVGARPWSQVVTRHS